MATRKHKSRQGRHRLWRRLRWVLLATLGLLIVGVGASLPTEAGVAVAALVAGLLLWRVYRRLKAPVIRDWRDAELAAATWLRRSGCRRVRLTAAGADGGIDVVTADLAVQVKHTSRPVGRPTLQQVVGAALTLDRAPAVFSTGGFTGPAVEYANDHDVAIFDLASDGRAKPLNRAARHVGRRSLRSGSG